jgi:site-specific recombinase XerD
MTSLRRRMTEDMQVRNLSSHTQATYVQQVSPFARHFNQSPEVVGPEEIRSYQVYLTNEKKLSPGSILIAVAALRFFYKVTLHKDWGLEEVIPAPKKPEKLPIVLSPEEVLQFLSWCQRCGFRNLEDIEPITVAAYIEQHSGSPATIKQHMAAIRMMFSWLTEKGILAMNPAREVKTPKFSRNEGKTPAPPAEEVQKLIDSIDLSHIVGLRDQAILGVLAYTFARIGAVVSLQVKDYFQVGKRSVLRFSEKGGKEKEIPVHHKLEAILDSYLDASELRNRPDSPLFLAARGKTRGLAN